MSIQCRNLLRRNASKCCNFISAYLNSENRIHIKTQGRFLYNIRRDIHRFTPNSFSIVRAMCTNKITNIDIKEYIQLKEDEKTTIIDVREKSEIAETGILPGAINIPLGEVASALQKDASSFEQLYKKDKPTELDKIIFSCRSGKRSMMAAEIAQKLGYENTLNLAGGWMAWEEYSKSDISKK